MTDSEANGQPKRDEALRRAPQTRPPYERPVVMPLSRRQGGRGGPVGCTAGSGDAVECAAGASGPV